MAPWWWYGASSAPQLLAHPGAMGCLVHQYELLLITVFLFLLLLSLLLLLLLLLGVLLLMVQKSSDHQLRLAVYPMIYQVLYIQTVVGWDFWTINSCLNGNSPSVWAIRPHPCSSQYWHGAKWPTPPEFGKSKGQKNCMWRLNWDFSYYNCTPLKTNMAYGKSTTFQ